MKHNKIIIWGAKLDTGHTNGFIHLGYYRAAKALGYEVYWLDNRDSIDVSFFDDALVITEQWLVFAFGASNNMPLNKTATYFVHYLGNKGNVEGNPGASMYLGKVKRLIDFRFTATHGWGVNGVLDKNYNYTFTPEKFQKISSATYFEKSNEYDNFYSMWATDLLPNEFNYEDAIHPRVKQAFFCGTIRDDNKDVFEGILKKCKKENIPIIYNNPTKYQMSTEEIRKYVRESLLPIDVRPKNHLAYGYIACRPIKNVSYGNIAITNSSAIRDFFNGNCAYAQNSADLFDVAIDFQSKIDVTDKIIEEMQKIQKEHTYINRLEDILRVYNDY